MDINLFNGQDQSYVSLTEKDNTLNSFSIIDFSNEVLLNIFHTCSAKSLCQISQTCKRFSNISGSNYLWKPLFRELFPQSYQSVTSNNEIDFKQSYQKSFMIHRRIANNKYLNDAVNSNKITCLKIFEGKILKFFLNDNPNLVRIYDGKVYREKDEDIVIIDDPYALKNKTSSIIFDNLNPNDFLTSFVIDKSKGHLYARFYDDTGEYDDENKREDVIKVIDLKTLKEINSFSAGKGAYQNGEQYGEDVVLESYNMRIQGNYLVAACYDKFQIWDIKQKDPVLVATLEHDSSIKSFKLYEDKLFYSVATTIHVWDLKKEERCDWNFDHHVPSEVTSIDIYDNKLFAGISLDGESYSEECESNCCVIVWDLKTKRRLTEFRETGLITQVKFDGERLYTAHSNNSNTIDRHRLNIRDFRSLGQIMSIFQQTNERRKRKIAEIEEK